jgi:tripartite-type tricarboxylate transporter receptor subunit TctC
VAAISGEVDEVIVSVASALSLIKQSKVRPLAVLSEKRVATLPNVPTSKEAGVDGFQVSIWYGMFAPSGTPHAIIARLNQEVFRALESREMRQRMDVMSINPWPGTPEQMGELLRTETARYAAIIKSAGLRPQ